MRKTPVKMHIHDMVTIDTKVSEIVGGQRSGRRGVGGLLRPPHGSLTFLNTPDRIGLRKSPYNIFNLI